MSVDIIYETHATTTDNEAGIATGWLPGHLFEVGRQQARELGERRRHDALAAIFTSDPARAVVTAEIAFGGRNIPIIQDARLRECHYGTLDGSLVSDLVPKNKQHSDDPFPGGQSYGQVVEQTRAFRRDLAAERDGQAVLIVAHSANRWALDHLLDGMPLEDLVDAPFTWQAGWRYALPQGWARHGPEATP